MHASGKEGEQEGGHDMDVHHHHSSGTTIVEDRDGPAMALIVLVVAVLVGFLVWLFGFSGVVFDRNSGGSTTRIEQTNNNPQDNTQPGGGTNPNPANT
jgi:hypothetical protein